MIKPRLFLCGNISLNNDDPLCEGRHPVALATHGPNAMDATESWMMQDYEHWEKRRIAKQAKGINLQFPLRVAVQKWPTPTSTERSGVNPNKPDVIQGLTHAVKLAEFPTPCASDSKDRGGMYNPAIQMRVEKGKQIQLSMVARYKAGGSLNPDWVEWLMGWPLGFTSLEPLGIMQWYLWFALFTGDNYEETDKGKHRASTGAKEVQGEGLCCVWFDNEAQPTPQGQEPVQQQEVECHDSLCNVPRKDSSGDGGQATCPASKVCRMWKRVSAKKDEEVDSLFSEMPFRAWKKERSQEMGWSKDDKNLCLLWQGICFQESQGDNMLSVMWEQARMGETWWSKEPIGLPRVATGVKDRVARLKAIGNGQVALCAATAWKLLTKITPRAPFPNV